MTLRKCSYYNERGKRCGKKGTGNPPLCSAHMDALDLEPAFDEDDPLNMVMGRVIEHPGVQQVLNSFQGYLDTIAWNLDRASRVVPPPPRQAPKNGQHTPPRRPAPPPPAPKPQNGLSERIILGFGPHVVLTAALVKERRRELAKLYHPDRGGSHEALARVNDAADRLLKNLS